MVEGNYDNIHWADNTAKKVIETFPDRDVYVVQSGVTPSGIIHVGHLRELATNELVRRALEDKGKKTRYLFSWDSYDAFRKVPKNLPPEWEKYLRLPLTKMPMPDDEKSFGDFYMDKGEEFLHMLNFPIESQNQSKLQTSGMYAEGIKDMLNNLDKIREIFNKGRSEDRQLGEDWFPLELYSEKTGKDTVKILDYDGEYGIKYRCEETGFENTIDFRNTPIVKLRFRLDWPMRWKHFGTNSEGGGKDYATPGSPWFTGKEILEEVFGIPGPVPVFYNFIGIKGKGGKISSSKGDGIVPQDLLEVYTKEMVMWLIAGTRPNAEFDISFDLDVIKLYEDFYNLERVYYGVDEEKNPKVKAYKRRVYELSMIADNNGKRDPQKDLPIQPSFRHLTTIVQSNDFNYEKVRENFNSEIKNDYDEVRLKETFECVKNWIERYAPDEMKFSIRGVVPSDFIEKLSHAQREAIAESRDALKLCETSDELFGKFKEIIEKTGIDMKSFFKLMYNLIIDKDRGPKLADFMVDNREKVEKVLEQI